jgi:hypothetical protein
MNLIIEILIIVAVAIPIQAVIIMVQTSVMATMMGVAGGKVTAAVLMAVTNTTVIKNWIKFA